MEDADERLYVSEISIPTIEQKNKEAGGYEKCRIEHSRYKGTQNSMTVPRSVDRLQYFEGKKNRGFD